MKPTALFLTLLAAVPARAGGRITVHADRETVSALMADVARQAHVRFMIAKDVASERITAYFNGVTVGDVLDVLKTYKGIEAHRLAGGSFSLARALAGTPAERWTAALPARHPS